MRVQRTHGGRKTQQLPHRPEVNLLAWRADSLSLSIYLSFPSILSIASFFIAKTLSTPGSVPALSPMQIRTLFVMGVAFWSCSSGPPDSPSDKNGNQITGLDAQPSERPVSPSE